MQKSQRWIPNAYHLLFFCTIVVASLIRFKYLYVERIWPDEALYSWCGLKIFNSPLSAFSREIIEFHPPLFSIFLAIGHIFASPELACRIVVCRIVSMLFNILGIIAMYALGIRFSGRFLGLFCAIVLSFNFLYLDISTYVLIDDAQPAFLMMFIFLLLKDILNNDRRHDIYVGLAGAAVILLKWSGILIVPIIVLYYMYAFRKLSILNIFKKISLPLMIIATTILLLLINNFIQLGHVLPNTSALKGTFQVKPFWFYIVNFHNILIIPYILPFFLYGLYIVAKERDNKCKLLLIWFVVSFIGISLVPEKVMRYGLLILPSSLLITGIGLKEAIKRISINKQSVEPLKIACIVCTVLACLQLYPRTEMLMDRSTKSSFGLKEAGLWIKEQKTEDTLVMAGSERVIRYYSGINFQRFGGDLMTFPSSREEFERIVGDIDKPMILVIDRWKETRQAWIYPIIYPFSQEKTRYLNNFGFQHVKSIKGKVFLPNGAQEVVAGVLIFKRN